MSEMTESQELNTSKICKKTKSDSHKQLSESDINSELIENNSDESFDIDDTPESSISNSELKNKLSELVHPSRIAKKKKPITSKSKKVNIMLIGKSKNKSVNYF